MTNKTTSKLAVLIDADNAQASLIAEILGEIARYGTATIKRAYGDWTTPSLSSWKKFLHVHAIQPTQQFSYTTGKNATDSALIIDAMDILHEGEVDGFCLISSDSDFTRLATRIREAGLLVYGFGEEKTPQPFVAACDKFIFTEILEDSAKESSAKKTDGAKLRKLLTSTISSAAQEDGWSSLAAVGGLINQSDPSFDSRNFGHKKLGDLVRAQTYLEIVERKISGGGAVIYVRAKET